MIICRFLDFFMRVVDCREFNGSRVSRLVVGS